MNDRGIGSWIERRARIAPDQPAIIWKGSVRSYQALARRILRLAHGLRRRGVRPGDRVGWLGPNHPAFLETLFASAKIGAVLCPVNHLLPPEAVHAIVADCGAVLVVLAGDSSGLSFPSCVQVRVSVDGSAREAIDYDRILEESDEAPIDMRVTPEDLCMLPHTSGTTGSAKGVMLTHGNVTWNAINLLTSADFRVGDVTIAVAPFFRVGGTGVNVLPILFGGGAVVVPSAPDPREILRLVEEHRVTVGFGNPDLLEALTRSAHWPACDLSHVRFIITGGAPVPLRLIHVYASRGVSLLQGYGLSEASPVVLLLDAGSAAGKPGSAGKPVLLVDVRVAGPDGLPCESGETGELLVRGPNVMAGYWNLPEDTRQAIDPDGWLHTGDAARLDEDGFVWIVDRVRDRYLSRGRVVYPGDVERVLVGHPGVADAGVVGVPGAGAGVATGAPEDGELTGAAFVVREQGAAVSADDLLELCRRSLAPYQVPVSLTFTEQLPRSSVGKLLRADLRRLAER